MGSRSQVRPELEPLQKPQHGINPCNSPCVPCISAVFLSWGCLWAFLSTVQRAGYFFSSQMTLICLTGNMQLCYIVQIVQIHLPSHWATYSLLSNILFLIFISSVFYFLHGLFLPPCLATLLIQVHRTSLRTFHLFLRWKVTQLN